MPIRPEGVEPPSPPTTVGEQLAWATRVLEGLGVSEPAVEAATLLAAAMDVLGAAPPHDPLAPLAASQVDRLLAAIARRLRDGHRGG